MPPVADLLARRDSLISEYTGLLRSFGRIPTGSRLPQMVTAFRSAGVQATGPGTTRITRPATGAALLRDPATSTVGAPALASLGPVGRTLGALTAGAQIGHAVLAPDLPIPARALEAASGAAGLTRIGADIPSVVPFIPGLTAAPPALDVSRGALEAGIMSLPGPGPLTTALPFVGPVLGMAGGALQGGERGALTTGANFASLALALNPATAPFAWVPQVLGLFGGGLLGRKKKKGPPITPAMEQTPGLRQAEGLIMSLNPSAGPLTDTIGGRVVFNPEATGGSAVSGGLLQPLGGRESPVSQLAQILSAEMASRTRQESELGIPARATLAEKAAQILATGRVPGISGIEAQPLTPATAAYLQRLVSPAGLRLSDPDAYNNALLAAMGSA